MPRYYIDSDPGKISPRIVSFPFSTPSLKVIEHALSAELGVVVHDVVRVELPDARDGHESFHFWQCKAVGALVTVMPIRTVRHLLEDGVTQRAGRGRRAGLERETPSGARERKGRSGGAAPLLAGEPVELLQTWASGGRTGKNSKAWIGGYVYDGERVVRGQVLAVVRRMKGTPGVTLVSPSEVRRATGVTRESW